MSPRDEAIRYCLSIRVDPHEMVLGWFYGEATRAPRWQWYVGARAGQ